MDQRDLLQRVNDMANCIGTQNWSGLAALYDSGYRGRRGLARYQSAEEEIIRLREEISSPGLTLKHYELTPHGFSIGSSAATVRVHERLELAWPDGCRRIALRRFEQCWRCGERGWRLRGTEALSGAERVHEESALRSDIEAALADAERYLKPRPGRAAPSDFAAGLAAGLCRRVALAPRLTVAAETRGIPPYAGEALRRACTAAMEAWNQSLHDVVELVEHIGDHPPDIMIRACNGPIYDSVLGFYLLCTPAMRSSPRKARLAELRISAFERSGRPALCLDPPELFGTVCHELGHCFGLGECTHAGRVMAPAVWTGPPVRVPFRAERRAIVHWLRLAYGLRARACQQLGQKREAEAAGERAEALEPEVRADVSELSHPRYDRLAENSYAPASVQQYWQGSAEARGGRFDEAVSCFERALEDGVYPELLLYRGIAQPSDEKTLADFRRAAELDPEWLTAHEYLLDLLEYHGMSREASIVRERVRRLKWRAEVDEGLLVAGSSSRPWEVAKALLRATERLLWLSGATAWDRFRRR